MGVLFCGACAQVVGKEWSCCMSDVVAFIPA
jgi:hypothetical protein